MLVQYSPSHLSKGRVTIRVIVLAQAAIQYHKLGGSNNRNLFLTVLEAGQFGSYGEPSSWLAVGDLLAVPWGGEREGGERERERETASSSCKVTSPVGLGLCPYDFI